MSMRRVVCVAALLSFFATTGCGAKTETPQRVPPPAAPEPVPESTPPARQPLQRPPAGDVPENPEPPPAVPSVPVTPGDRARVAEAEKKGAAIYEAQNGGYDVHVEASADASAILTALAGTKCVVGLSIENNKLTDAALAPLSGFEYLERLTLHACPKVTGVGFDALTGLRHLKTIAISECPLADVACKPLGRVGSLEEVRFLRTKVTDVGLSELAALPALESLGLEGSPVTGSAFAAAGWTRLRYVDAANTAFNDAGMQAVAGVPALASLRVDSCNVTDAGLAHLQRAKKLTELSLNATKVTDAGWELVKKDLQSLRVLEVANTPVSGAAFGSRPDLRKLNAGGTKIDDRTAALLAGLSGLTSLSLANCPVSDSSLKVLKDLKKLANCDVSGTGAGDETAKVVGSLPDLEAANFARTKITDAGLMALASGTKIRLVDARGTKATREGAERAGMGRVRVEIRVE